MISYLIRFYLWLGELIPHFKKMTRKFMYNVMARFIKQEEWTFMNYGYATPGSEEHVPELETQDEVNRLSFQLYHHLASKVNLSDKNVLEVGSGRGGGAWMLKKYHRPNRLTGLDFSGSAIKLCKQTHQAEGLSFVQGDAENLPFDPASFDAVINVESSHCYPSMPRFLQEVKKVLKPEGHFLLTDFRAASDMPALDKMIQESGMRVIHQKDITTQVLLALDADHDRRMLDIKNNVPRMFVKQFRQFAGVKNSVIYNEFLKRDTIYFSYVLQKV